MKTLDEVIEILQRQTDKTRIKILDKDLLDSVPDALYYLKAYKEDRNELTALRAYWKEMHKDVRQKAEENNENAR